MRNGPVDAEDAQTRLWDVVVVGTGVGGATLGQALARDGLSVLFLERGSSIPAGLDLIDEAAPEARQAKGWWPYPVSQRRDDGRCDQFFAAVGCAWGGSSIHYAAALERMAPSDFDALSTPRQHVPPWPVSFTDFMPFYEAAESLYRIPPADEQRLSAWDRALMDAMRRNGLRPDLLQVAIRYDQDCKECIGRVCPRSCKSDARTACLDQALAQQACAVLDRCEVLRIEADARRVRCVHARRDGQVIEVRGKVVVLSAGALHSPQILLRSANSHWPRGLANGSDQVGRNLMFHTADIYALFAPRRLDRQARQKKSISVRDFYLQDGARLGYVQSMGIDAGRGAIAGQLKDMLRRRGLRNELLLSLLVKIPSHLAAWLLGSAGVFAAMTEDDPDPDNRIVLDDSQPDGAHFTYAITADLQRRADALREAFAGRIRPWRLVRLSPTLTMNYGHPCGTCRFGDDPDRNVLDPHCKAHGLDNLFVVDASFMPRSGAINPSLTIAANALRVAPHVAAAVNAAA